jgi:murein DD-endopeptidase MepM/ murein hydrolase activator NlpD
VGGTVVKLSGKDPKLGGKPGGALGYSVYLQGDDGTTYFMTHIDGLTVKAGQKVQQGQRIAVVADGPASWSSPHVHMGVHG